MFKKQSDPKTRILSTNKPLMPTCLYVNTHVSTSRAYMLPTSTDDVFAHNAKPCIKPSQSSVTVPSAPPVCRATSVHDNVIKKPITCCDPVIKRPRKCLRKSTIVKNRNAVNYVSESVNNVVNCSRSFPSSSSGFLRQPVRFNKSVHKQISSSVVNGPTSADASKTCSIVKCKTEFYDVWIQFLILFLLVTLSYGYLSFNLGCYYLKANTTANNLATRLTFIKYYIYNFSDCIGKILFKVLFFYSNLYQCFLISIHFFLVCKLASILSQFAFTFFTMSISGIFRKSFLFGLQKERGKTEKRCRGSFNTLLWKANPCSYLQHVYQRSCSFCYNVLNFYFYIFENLIDIIILLDILLSLIGALSKYLFLSCFKSLRFLFLSFSIIATTFYNIFYNNNFTRSKCCFDNINIYINTSVRSLCLANVFIFDQKETISVSSTPSSSITSYNLIIFYFIGAILSSIFYKKDNFNITKQFFPFLIYFFSLF